jgi:hypothetical protein
VYIVQIEMAEAAVSSEFYMMMDRLTIWIADCGKPAWGQAYSHVPGSAALSLLKGGGT